MANISIPESCVVVLIGASGSGKSTFARTHFKATEILSSDHFRGVVSDDENSLEATQDAFDVLFYIMDKRLRAMKLCVIDATNVRSEDRKRLIAIARDHHLQCVALVLNLPETLCQERNKSRPDRQFGRHVVRNQVHALKTSLGNLRREGFRYTFEFRSLAEIESLTIDRVPLWTNLKGETGPFDFIGDVHGCFPELQELLTNLGYTISRREHVEEPEPSMGHWATGMPRWFDVTAPEGRKVVFVGDLVDRGPDTPSVLKLVMQMIADKQALCVPGNHDEKYGRLLGGRDVKIAHGLQQTIDQMAGESDDFRSRVRWFIESMVSHFVLDDGNVIVAHAGMRQDLQGRASSRVRDFALYGETTGETDEFGLPVRFNWAEEYKGRARVVYGHTPVPEADWVNRTINIDTGCVFGGKLTALRYPEMELVSVPAKEVYAESKKPFLEPANLLSAQHEVDDVLDLQDVIGKRIVTTRLARNVTIREENATAALEAMSRFATNPKWLVYLPPTMSPSETTAREGLLEHPEEAIAYYKNEGVEKVVCEEKHMGSRAVAIVCREPSVAASRFGILDETLGTIYTRTGRRFFDDLTIEQGILTQIRDSMTASGFWDELQTDWVVLDCELMPWSAKAQELLRRQYAPVGASSAASLASADVLLEQFLARGLPDAEEEYSAMKSLVENRRDASTRFVESYRNYCWTVRSLNDLRLAPFHILATEGAVHVDKDHLWHMNTIASFCAENTVLFKTPYLVVDTQDDNAVAKGIAWWEELTGKGGEGMVVKPLDFVVMGKRGALQPAVKCRGPEYLRIIYGPHYLEPENLRRLKRRGLSVKRSLAGREFALGIEALERFVRREPLRAIHECVFGVLAMESEPVDPRL